MLGNYFLQGMKKGNGFKGIAYGTMRRIRYIEKFNQIISSCAFVKFKTTDNFVKFQTTDNLGYFHIDHIVLL